jgi:hypothetical protein
MPKEPDLTKLAKKLTSKRLACTEEIKSLMDCMMVGGGVEGRGWDGGGAGRGVGWHPARLAPLDTTKHCGTASACNAGSPFFLVI